MLGCYGQGRLQQKVQEVHAHSFHAYPFGHNGYSSFSYSSFADPQSPALLVPLPFFPENELFIYARCAMLFDELFRG